jgi:ribosomal-protein-alanine N-acetyltransferase
VIDSGELVGYCCFGRPARVPGAEERPGTLDVGYGLAPEWMGRGAGRRFVGAILAFAERRFEASRHRMYVLEWNRRSRRVAEALGFVLESELRSDEGTFLVLVRNVDT